MTDDRQEKGVLAVRRGFPVWGYNPSAADVKLRQKERPVRLERGQNLMLVNPQTSEVMAEGTVGFFRREVVDDERFMKVFMGQLDHMFDLTKAGQRILKIIWEQLHNDKDKDKVELTPLQPSVTRLGVTERAFQRGVRELLEKKFVFMSPVDGVYFINMGMFFNGNRIVAAVEYIREGSQEQLSLLPPQEQITDRTGDAV
jgi:hypothetical protein